MFRKEQRKKVARTAVAKDFCYNYDKLHPMAVKGGV
jgi:hypothetical protein